MARIFFVTSNDYLVTAIITCVEIEESSNISFTVPQVFLFQLFSTPERELQTL